VLCYLFLLFLLVLHSKVSIFHPFHPSLGWLRPSVVDSWKRSLWLFAVCGDCVVGSMRFEPKAFWFSSVVNRDSVWRCWVWVLRVTCLWGLTSGRVSF
jgi:hypothetical protein